MVATTCGRRECGNEVAERLRKPDRHGGNAARQHDQHHRPAEQEGRERPYASSRKTYIPPDRGSIAPISANVSPPAHASSPPASHAASTSDDRRQRLDHRPGREEHGGSDHVPDDEHRRGPEGDAADERLIAGSVGRTSRQRSLARGAAFGAATVSHAASGIAAARARDGCVLRSAPPERRRPPPGVLPGRWRDGVPAHDVHRGPDRRRDAHRRTHRRRPARRRERAGRSHRHQRPRRTSAAAPSSPRPSPSAATRSCASAAIANQAPAPAADDVVDAHGGSVLPGFNDAHVHLMSGGLGSVRAEPARRHDARGASSRR